MLTSAAAGRKGLSAARAAILGAARRLYVAHGASGVSARKIARELGCSPTAIYLYYRNIPDIIEHLRLEGHTLDARAMMARVAEVTVPRPAMLEAIRRIRARGLLAAAVTNNWITEDEGTGVLRPHFDAFVESAVAGVRKPDPRIYELACAELRIAPPEAVMLDDIGANLKTARALGMATIRVGDPDAALGKLEELLGFPLR